MRPPGDATGIAEMAVVDGVKDVGDLAMLIARAAAMMM